MSDFLRIKSLFRNYNVHFVGDFTLPLQGLVDQHAFFIIDAIVWEIYKEKLRGVVPGGRLLIVEANENNKSLDKCRVIIETLVERQVRRNEWLVAMGGGIIQDVTAFSASIIYRGIDWAFFPTTLLAQADSCIGSKTSINLGEKKNLVGNFYPPSDIFVDATFLESLTVNDIKSGIGEILHYYLYAASPLFDELVRDYAMIIKDRNLLMKYIRESLKIKKSVIENDEFDRGERNKFNYGHTFGHAIESVTDYAIKHGQAVTVGMDLANYVSMKMGFMSLEIFHDFHTKLSINFPEFDWNRINLDRYFELLSKDKKNVGNSVGCILAKDSGILSKEQLPLDDNFKKMIRSYFSGQALSCHEVRTQDQEQGAERTITSIGDIRNQSKLKGTDRNLIEMSEIAADHCIDSILNDFFFFCTFSKDLPSYDFLYRRLIGKPYSKYPVFQAIKTGIKSYAITLLRLVRNRIFSKGPIITGGIASKTNVLIVTWLHDASMLLNNRIDKEDTYFGSLGRTLKEQGYHLQYLLYPMTKQVAKDSSTTLDLHKNLIINTKNVRSSFNDLASSLNSISKSFSFDLQMDEYISYVTGFHRFNYILSKQLFAILTEQFIKSNISHIFIPWEAQPLQKAICLAAHAAGIKVWGYCHSTINGSSLDLLNNDWRWCPDIMLMNGISYVPIMEEMGWKNKVQVIRSLRYRQTPERHTFEGKVFLPYDIKESITTLKILKLMVFEGHCMIKEIRRHPDRLNHSEIHSLMRDIPTNTNAKDVYVGGFTSVIFEALQAGCIVYNIQTDILHSEDAYKKFSEIKVTRLNSTLLKFEPIGDMKDYFFCFDEDKAFKLSRSNAR